MRAGECRIKNSALRLLWMAKRKVHSKVFIEKSIKKSNHQGWLYCFDTMTADSIGFPKCLFYFLPCPTRRKEQVLVSSEPFDMLKLLCRILTISLRRKPRPLGRRGCQERRKTTQAERKSPESEKIPDFYLGCFIKRLQNNLCLRRLGYSSI